MKGIIMATTQGNDKVSLQANDKVSPKSTAQTKRSTTAKTQSTKASSPKPKTPSTKATSTKATSTKTPSTNSKTLSQKNSNDPAILSKAMSKSSNPSSATKSTQTKAKQAEPKKTVEAKHNEEISNMFGNISKHYDILNHVLSFGIDFCWRRRLVNSIILGSKAKVLDMAAGTLDVSLAILRKYPQAHVVAGDISEEMLEMGKKKIRAAEKDRIDSQVMDAQKIPHADESFDAVTIAFGIRNVEDRLKALKEMNRVLVNGGQLCILEFAPLTTPYVGKAYHWYLENIVPKIAKLFGEQESAYKYLAETVKDFPSPQDFCHEIKKAGFNFIRHESLTFGVANLYVAIKT